MAKIRLAVFVSGSGRSLENLAQLIAAGELDCEIGLVVSDRDGVAALDRAERAGVDHLVLPYRDLGGASGFSKRAFEELEARGCNRVVLAGFLRLLKLPEGWEGRVMNIHPSLLPRYGGKGFYGDHVHRAVLEAGDAVTGCTVHLIDDHYDKGSILLQREVPVREGNTVDALAARVFDEEKKALPDAIRMWIAEE